MAITQHGMDALSKSLFMLVMLILDFGMFQYLMAIYFARRRERRIQMLLLASFIGFASHVYTHEDVETMLMFNDISEVCAQLTFLIQITIIGHAVRAKVKLRSITWFTYVAEALIVVDWLNMLAAVIETTGVEVGDELHVLSNVVESVTLTFVPIFRFFYLSMSGGGFRRLLAKRKLELFFYVLVATHEHPFLALQYATGVSWEYAQGVYMRSMIVVCILLNLRKKASNSATRVTTSAKTSTTFEESGPPSRAFNAVMPLSSHVASSIRSTISRGMKSVKSGTSLKSGRSASNITRIGVAGPAPHQLT